MTQHPFEHEFSEREIAKLNALEEQSSFEEITPEKTKQIFGGTKKIDSLELTTLALGEEGGEPELTTLALGEEGGDPYP